MDVNQTRFEQLVEKIRTLPAQGPVKVSAEQKLKLYGLYRQAVDGDAVGDRPGLLDPIGRLKFDAWAAHKGMERREAMRFYVALAESVALQGGVVL